MPHPHVPCRPEGGRKPGRFEVRAHVGNLTELERDLLNSLIAILTDPQLRAFRGLMLRGKICLAVESGIVTWADHNPES